MLASACPRVSWKCTASAAIGTSAATARSIARALPGVPMPMVSPSETSSQPRPCRRAATRTTSASGTSPW